MSRPEIIAFNAGVAAVMQLAAQSADALEGRLLEKPTRFNFAVEALRAVADGSLTLMIPAESRDEPTP